MQNKEVALLEKKVVSALAISQKLEIKDEKTLVKGIDFLKNIKTVGKAIKQQKDKVLDPAKLVVKNFKEMFKPVEDNYAEAEKNVKSKILTYNLEVEKKNREKEEKIAKRIEKGTMKVETAVKKMEDIKGASKEGNVGKVSMRTLKKVKILDESKIPREYLEPNMSKIKKVVLAGVEIAGVTVVEEKIIAGL